MITQIAQMTGCQSSFHCGRATTSTRNIAANAATFEADAMKAVTGVGAPWYTSGVHTWNGAADTLNERPTSNSAIPTSTIASLRCTGTLSNAVTMALKLVEPVPP